jgi:hypothetical protein
MVGLDRGPREGDLVRVELLRGSAEVALDQRLQLNLGLVALQPCEGMRGSLSQEQRLQLGGVGRQVGAHVSLLWILTAARQASFVKIIAANAAASR